MSFILNLIGAAVTFSFGVWALFQPHKMARLLSLTPYKSRGVTEIRSTYGGWMMGLSGYTLYNQSSVLFICLGVGWILTAIVRTTSMALVEKNYSSIEVKVILFELVMGVFLLLPS